MALVNDTRSQAAQIPMSRILSPSPLPGPEPGQWDRTKSMAIPLSTSLQNDWHETHASAVSHSSVAQNSWPPQTKTNPGSYPSTRSPSRPLAKGSHQLGLINVKSDHVDELFRIFFDKYHPHLPFLDPLRSPDEYFSQSSLLFWSIISVAGRQWDQDIALLPLLASPVTRLAWDTIRTFPSSLASLQALLLLCTWPFPTVTRWLEPTHAWISMATSMAQQLGLPGPDRSSEYSRAKRRLTTSMEDERLRTWAACVIVTQNAATASGIMPSFSFGLTIHSSLEEPYIRQLPYDLRQFCMIARFSHRIGSRLSETFCPDGGNLAPVSATQHMPQLETELGVLQQSVDISNKYVLCQMLSVKLAYYVHYFYLPTWENGRKRGILECYAIAQEFISEASSIDRVLDLFRHISGSLFLSLFTATCVLWKVLHSGYHADVDFAAGRATFNSAIRALRACSIENNDNAARHAEILVHLWTVAELQQHRTAGGEPLVIHRSRHGASLTYDCLFYWRNNVGGKVTNGLHTSPTVPVDRAGHGNPPAADGSPGLLDTEPWITESQLSLGIDMVDDGLDLDASSMLFAQL
ncbi:hypothetical protein PV10_00352 [Exophiala mesophila]|uniref:Xylanolytic transcriptional activator regulatory domain-containing protein n=1 Tax=Exophiala mesophila TaxID=212818 RepID=A0A0D1X3V7_EXOME|nr:uncharacterized protein PV10_00352 [Exophiala mesophila]KIV96490.1 hypothetical protein PV10_00352 [Exophiala mesophila]